MTFAIEPAYNTDSGVTDFGDDIVETFAAFMLELEFDGLLDTLWVVPQPERTPIDRIKSAVVST